MKKIQHYLKTCDRKSVIDAFLYKHAFSYSSLMSEKLKDVTIGEYVDRVSQNVSDLIDRLISIEPAQDDEWVLMAVHNPSEDDDVIFNLYKIEDLYNNDRPQSYSYAFDKFENALSFFVADNYLTQYYIEDLIVDFLFEVSWTGYEQEELDSVLEELDETMEDIKENPDRLIPLEEGLKELGLDFELEVRDEKEEEAWKEYIKDSVKYADICRKIEIEKFKELQNV